MMETKYGIPWIKVNFIGAKATAKSLRKIAEYFGDKKLIDTVEKVIAEEMPEVEEVSRDVRTRTEGKTAMMFVGGSRAHHYQELFKEMGMKTISAGYEFAHRDDYEGRQVIPNLKVDADSRNIEEIEVEADADRYKPRKSDKQLKALEKAGYKFKDYDGMIPEMDKGDPGYRRSQSVRGGKAGGADEAGHLLRRDQGEVLHPEAGRAHEAAAQLRLRRPLCRLSRGPSIFTRRSTGW